MSDADFPELPARVPNAVREKLLAISEVARERNAAARSNSAEMRATLNDLAIAREKLWELDRQGRKVNHPAIIEARAKIARNETAAAAIRARQEKLGPQSTSAHALITCLLKYVRAQAAGGIMLYTGDVPQLRAGETALEGLERAARRTRTLHMDRREVVAAPLTSDMAKKIAWERLQARAEAAKPDVSPALDCGEAVRFPTSRSAIEQYGGSSDLFAVDVVGLLAWLHPDAMRAAIGREIEANAEDEIALSTTDRVERLETIDSDILASEREEVAFAAIVGQLPRPDIDPRAALGLAGTMPATTKD